MPCQFQLEHPIEWVANGRAHPTGNLVVKIGVAAAGVEVSPRPIGREQSAPRPILAWAGQRAVRSVGSVREALRAMPTGRGIPLASASRLGVGSAAPGFAEHLGVRRMPDGRALVDLPTGFSGATGGLGDGFSGRVNPAKTLAEPVARGAPPTHHPGPRQPFFRQTPLRAVTLSGGGRLHLDRGVAVILA
jgi:hypothetical protein